VALDDSEIAMLIKRGNSLLKDGDFTAARLLFERGADAGSAEAALALGSAYDPLVIKAAWRPHGKAGRRERPKMVPDCCRKGLGRRQAAIG
jgi:hypothetical protein